MSARIRRADGDELVFDATDRYETGRAASVTVHPVEEGAEVSDHSQPDAETIQLGGLVTQYLGRARYLQALAYLDRIVVTGEPVEVEHPRIGLRRNLVCEGYTLPLDQRGGFRFDASFRQIRIVGARVVEIPAGQPPPVAADLAATSEGGKQAAQEAPPAQAARARSLAVDLGDLLGVL